MNNKIITTILAFGIAASSAFAATSGTISISGTVPEIAAIQASDTGAATIDSLGNQVYSNTKVGEIVLDSNDTTGFTLTYSSSTSGFLALNGTSTDDDSRISYTVSLTETAGTLGTNVVVANETDTDPNNGEVTFTAAGNDATPTHGLTYDVGISTGIKGLVQGSYSDTLTVTIANQ